MNAPSPPAARVLVLLAPSSRAAGAARTVAGLRVLERLIRSARSAGYARTLLLRAPDVLTPRAGPSDGAIEEAPLAPDDDDARAESLGRECAGADAVVAGADLVLTPARLGEAAAGERLLDDGPGAVRVANDASARRATDLLFGTLARSDLTPVARALNKPISFWITRHLLLRLPVTPNQITLASAAIGAAGCLLIARPGYAAGLLGALLLHAQSVLDGCDGEVARLKHRCTRLGAWLDTIVDDASNLAIAVCLGVGLGARTGRSEWVVAGVAAAALGAVYDFEVYRTLIAQRLGGYGLAHRWFWESADPGRPTVARETPLTVLRFLGRRDTWLLGYLLLFALDLRAVALVHQIGLGAFYGSMSLVNRIVLARRARRSAATPRA